MIDRLRTLSARLITRWLPGPRVLLIRAWFWLAAQATDPAEKLRCLDEILLLDPDNKPANAALQGVVQAYSHVTYLHPANAEELANIAEETGAEVLRGPLRYPSESGGWQLGDIDLSEHLAKYQGHDLIVIIAPTGLAEADKERYVCGICGFAMTELGDCPRCKLQNEETAQGLRRRQEREALFRQVDDVVSASWHEE